MQMQVIQKDRFKWKTYSAKDEVMFITKLGMFRIDSRQDKILTSWDTRKRSRGTQVVGIK